MKSIMRKTTLREIKGSFGRYVAILAIVALGVGFFSGLKVCKSAMIQTVDNYFNETNFYHYRLLSTLGFEKEDVASYLENEDVLEAQGSVYTDFLYLDQNQEEGVLHGQSLTPGINEPVVIYGRMPENETECVVDSLIFNEDALGKQITVSANNEEDTLDLFKYQDYTIVGVVKSPAYINFERGNTDIGNGKIDGFVYFNYEAFDCDYFMEIYLYTNAKGEIFSEEYKNSIEALDPAIEETTQILVNNRYETIVSDATIEITDAKDKLATEKQDALEELADAKAELDSGLEEITNGEKELADAIAELADAQQVLDDKQSLLDTSWKELNSSKATYLQSKAEFEAGEAQTLAAIAAGYYTQEEAAYLQQTLEVTRQQLEAAGAEIAAGEAELTAGEQQLKQGQKELEEARALLEEKEAELEDAKETYADGEAEYLQAYEDFETEIADAEAEIADGEQEISDIEKPEYYMLGRETNVGYVCFENDSGIVEGIANVFPIFFFLVAALVCITTMNRMVEEQRTQIGVLKALGYSKTSIMGKYMYYSGSGAIAGGVGGYFIGTIVFPLTIWKAYGMMYNVDNLIYVFDLPLAIISMIVAGLCSFGTTYISCRYELHEVPAELIRPKAPKNGKRIFLERIPLIWNHMKFLHKVSIRNIFRYKRRFFMMVIGIGGCTALLLTGFGIKDSVANVAAQQFNEIQTYDISLSLKNDMTEGEIEELNTQADKIFTEYMYFAEMALDLEVEDGTKAISVVIPSDMEQMAKFIDLHNEKGEALPSIGEDEIILSKKLCNRYNLEIGDKVVLRDADMNSITVTLIGISENFVYNFGYFTKETYEKQMGSSAEFKSIYGNVGETTDLHQAAADLMDNKNVTASTVNEDIKERFTSMMASLDYVIVLVILSAGALAFIVLYNLTNINITERIREIATIKVLGFLPMETVSYVFRENLMLTLFGTATGLVMGFFLHKYVMFNIDVDVVAFDVHISPKSYVLAIIFTFAFALLVNIVMYFKLERINMAESLKSIE